MLPALVGVAFHGTWTALITAEVAAIGLPDDCDLSQLASSSVLWLLISFALTTLLQCVVAGISMRGGWCYYLGTVKGGTGGQHPCHVGNMLVGFMGPAACSLQTHSSWLFLWSM